MPKSNETWQKAFLYDLNKNTTIRHDWHACFLYKVFNTVYLYWKWYIRPLYDLWINLASRARRSLFIYPMASRAVLAYSFSIIDHHTYSYIDHRTHNLLSLFKWSVLVRFSGCLYVCFYFILCGSLYTSICNKAMWAMRVNLLAQRNHWILWCGSTYARPIT